MRASTLNLVTLREDPADAEIASHRLLMRAGFIYKSGAGLYLYAHLLKRVLDKISAIVSEEITEAGGVEVTMPILQERPLWERSGRWAGYQATQTMLTVTDRGGQQFGLAPTAEEVVTDYAASQVSSYKQLPVCYFQQHTKFRDEIRPRFGLMRVKEFIMMDAYSFHVDETSLAETYAAMHDAYLRAFRRCGLEAFAVEADTGAIGGSASHEFMIAADVGEDAILIDEANGYAANVERAECVIRVVPDLAYEGAAVRVETPNAGSIPDVVAHLVANGYPSVVPAHLLKTILYMAETADGDVRVAAVVRGDRDVNEVKLANVASRAITAEGGVLNLRAMTPEEVQAATGARPGFAGPGAGLSVDQLIIDEQVKFTSRWVVGANANDVHIVGFDLEKDCVIEPVRADIVLAAAGDRSKAGGDLSERRGIEAGHIFQLGTKYSEAMDATFTGEDGRRHPLVMGCYGIGTSRLAAAAVEQHHDDNGICWPMPIAPYQCVIVPTRWDDDQLRTVAEQLYQDLRAVGVECILDDRGAKPGVKFKDWDLVGIPVRVVAGRGVADGQLELKQRSGASEDVAIADARERVLAIIRDGIAASATHG